MNTIAKKWQNLWWTLKSLKRELNLDWFSIGCIILMMPLACVAVYGMFYSAAESGQVRDAEVIKVELVITRTLNVEYIDPEDGEVYLCQVPEGEGWENLQVGDRIDLINKPIFGCKLVSP